MRKILVLLMLMMAMGMVFADDVQGINTGATVDGDGAFIPVNLTISEDTAGQFIVGFSKTPVSSSATVSDDNKVTSAELKPNAATGKAFLAKVNNEDSTDLYVFWQIQSSKKLDIQLETTAMKSIGGSDLDWTINDVTSTSTPLIDGITNKTYGPVTIAEHTPNNTFDDNFGSIKLGMETGSYLNKLTTKSAEYSASLTVRVVTGS